MRLTLLAFVLPMSITLLTNGNPELRSVTLFFGLWALAGLPVVGVYWLTRLIRFAWRGGSRAAV